MRQLLDVLRADGGGDPTPSGVGAPALPALVKEARSAGLPASLTVTGEAVALPRPWTTPSTGSSRRP